MAEFLETSILVRYLTDDPPELSERAELFIESAAILLITAVALVETGHVLRTVYKLPRQEIVDLLIDFIQKDNVSVHHLDKALVITALLLCRPSGRVSLPDALIWAEARMLPGSVVYSFDQRFPSEGIELKEPV